MTLPIDYLLAALSQSSTDSSIGVTPETDNNPSDQRRGNLTVNQVLLDGGTPGSTNNPSPTRTRRNIRLAKLLSSLVKFTWLELLTLIVLIAIQ